MSLKDSSISRANLFLNDSMFMNSTYQAQPKGENDRWKDQFYHPRGVLPQVLTVLPNINTAIIQSVRDVIMQISSFKPAKIGDRFKGSWAKHWFYVKFVIPQEWLRNKEEIHFVFNSNSEALLFNMQGEVLQGLSGDQGLAHRIEYIFPPILNIQANRQIEFLVEMSGTNLFGNFVEGNMKMGVNMEKEFELNTCELRRFRRNLWDLYMDIWIMRDYQKHSNASHANVTFKALNQILNVWESECDTQNEDDKIRRCRKISRAFLQAPNSESQHQIYAIGHCHIDLAWLWPFSETRKKAGRSWSSQIQLMEKYPNFKFTASQAQLFHWVKKDYPDLFQKVLQKTKEGQFVVVGGTWCEFDGNIPTGESFCRQFLKGQEFFKKHFEKYCDVFFLPDTFGYSAQLPQIAKLSGITNFITQKISWNLFNKFPHSTFIWKGLDGTELLTHFPPADTYNGDGELLESLLSQTNFKNKGSSNSSVLLFGIGDGGGGPQSEMIEKLERVKDLEGIPKLKFAATSEFFSEVRAKDLTKLPRWEGDLFLELHNGTYTSQAMNKKNNRKCEFLFRKAELLSVIASLINSPNFKIAPPHYPKEKLQSCWRKFLLYQFHDVLPGSSISLVYQDTERGYTKIIGVLEKLIKELYNYISQILTGQHSGEKNVFEEKILFVFNSLPFQQNQLISHPYLSKQFQVEVKGLSGLFIPVHNSEFSMADEKCGIRWKVENKNFLIENELIIIKINETTGIITSILDKETTVDRSISTMKEIVAPNSDFEGAGSFYLHEDIPIYWDAWDIWLYYKSSRIKILPHHYQILKDTLQTFQIRYDYSISTESEMRVTLEIKSNSKIIDFKVEVNWHECHKLLRVYFPFNIRSKYVTCDTQCGTLTRPTTSNTSWEIAQYEFCSHKFVDLSDSTYGVAILNDSKYGYSASENIIGLSLLKSPKAPDMNADMGRHTFKFGCYPHQGNFSHSNVQEQSYGFNEGLDILPATIPGPLKEMREFEFFELTASNIFMDCLKFGETDIPVIIRFHESIGNRTPFKFRINSLFAKIMELKFVQVQVLSILERPISTIDEELSKCLISYSDTEILLIASPYQIITLGLWIKPFYRLLDEKKQTEKKGESYTFVVIILFSAVLLILGSALLILISFL